MRGLSLRRWLFLALFARLCGRGCLGLFQMLVFALGERGFHAVFPHGLRFLQDRDPLPVFAEVDRLDVTPVRMLLRMAHGGGADAVDVFGRMAVCAQAWAQGRMGLVELALVGRRNGGRSHR